MQECINIQIYRAKRRSKQANSYKNLHIYNISIHTAYVRGCMPAGKHGNAEMPYAHMTPPARIILLHWISEGCSTLLKTVLYRIRANSFILPHNTLACLHVGSDTFKNKLSSIHACHISKLAAHVCMYVWRYVPMSMWVCVLACGRYLSICACLCVFNSELEYVYHIFIRSCMYPRFV